MITAKALKRHLKALGKELADNCYCEEPGCELNHPYDGSGLGVPPYGITMVTPDGELDEDANKRYIAFWWGLEAHHDAVVDHINMLDDLATNLVVIQHATGVCWSGIEFR